MSLSDLLNDPEGDIDARLGQVVQDAIDKVKDSDYQPSAPLPFRLKDMLAEYPEDSQRLLHLLAPSLHHDWSTPTYDYVLLRDGRLIDLREARRQMQQEVLRRHPGIAKMLGPDPRHFSLADTPPPS